METALDISYTGSTFSCTKYQGEFRPDDVEAFLVKACLNYIDSYGGIRPLYLCQVAGRLLSKASETRKAEGWQPALPFPTSGGGCIAECCHIGFRMDHHACVLEDVGENLNNLSDTYRHVLTVETVCKVESNGDSSNAANNHQHNLSHIYFQMHSSNRSRTFSQLSYVGQDCWKIPPVLAQMYGTKVKCLDLSFNCLTTLQGVEMFPNLEELVLDNNKLSDSMLVPALPNLRILSLNKNKISNLELLLTKIGHSLPSLHYLSLLGNVACPNQLSDIDKDEEDYQRYRFYVLHHLQGLKFLDSRHVSSEERKEAQHRGKFMKIVRPDNSMSHRGDVCGGSPPSSYTPLPRSSRGIGDHQGAYGKCRYRYSGKHSEGNRFIQNSDL